MTKEALTKIVYHLRVARACSIGALVCAVILAWFGAGPSWPRWVILAFVVLIAAVVWSPQNLPEDKGDGNR